MIWLIARREIVTRGRTKPFLAITAVMFVLIIAIAIAIPFITGGDDEAREIKIGLDGPGESYAAVLAEGNDDIDPEIVLDSSVEDLEADEVDVLFDGTNITWETEPDNEVDVYIRQLVQSTELNARADDLGLDDRERGILFTPVEIAEVRLDDDDERAVRIAAAAAAAVATLLLIQVWATFVMMGVVEEKSSRVVEVLLSHVRPHTLLAGKVIGLAALAFFQMIIIAVGIAVALLATRDIEIPNGVWSMLPLLIVTFLLGFAFYATASAAVGSTVSRQEDAQTAQLPVVMPLFVGYVIAFSSISEPDNSLARIGMLVPFTSPVVLPFRVALGSPAWWEVALSLLILAVSSLVMIRLAARIYRASLLRTGSRISLRDAWRSREAV